MARIIIPEPTNTVSNITTSLTATAGAVPIAGNDGTLDTSWVPDAAPSNVISTPTTITVKTSGGNFTTIQAAWDSLKDKTIAAAVIIKVDPGTWTENISLSGQPYADLITISGDARSGAGVSYIGTGNITKVGNDCTITVTASPDGLFGSSDYVVIGGTTTAGNVGRFPIVSINEGNKTITYTNASGAAEAVLAITTATLCPDRIITANTGTVLELKASVNVNNFTILSAAGLCVLATSIGYPSLTKIVASSAASIAFLVVLGAAMKTTNCTAYSSSVGFIADSNAFGYFFYPLATNCGSGVQSGGYSFVYVESPKCYKCTTYGVSAYTQAMLVANSAASKYCGTGFHSIANSYLQAQGSNTNNSNNSTNYSPALTDTEGNIAAIINWS